ncbi:extradiol ring-cleavage dioxygenase [Priestia endophytica]|uniref:DODA-type extradiol aromatic ring-opening family dioxygenase n=1 Tax=Priestia endophytica TaxID=135735 RepID=UPI000DCA6911|nr:extradiol ring-cleavage dioxygenase [Priestia endophytica]RAS83655.1 extradiol ring-cleavage dioxygenase [Priestia endophytica]
MSLDLALLSSHAPSLLYANQAPDYQMPIVQAFHQQRERIEQLKPDVLVIISSHFLTNWKHYVDATPQHKGFLTAREHPDMIANIPFNYPGDEELAAELAKAGKEVSIPTVTFNEPTYIWDYGTLVPLRYFVPNENIPVVELSCNMSASLEETYLWGQQIGKVLRASKKRTVFASSGALAHNLTRGRENMPTLSEKALDDKFIQLLVEGKYDDAWAMLPQFSVAADVESGGRHVAALLGVLGKEEFNASFLGYAQSSGSGNPHFAFEPIVNRTQSPDSGSIHLSVKSK